MPRGKAQPPAKSKAAKGKGKGKDTPKVEHIDKAVAKQEEPYSLPLGCEEREVLGDILNYGVFEFEDAVYSVYNESGAKGKYGRRQVANFTCHIEAHIDLPEGTALKLLTIRNIYKENITYHVAGDALLTLPQFRKVTDGDKGNFSFDGTDLVYRQYYRLMKDRMGRGRIIRELGMQPEGFFVFCNAVILPNGEVEHINDQGCFDFEGNRFYVPAAKSNGSRGSFANAKKVCYIESDITFERLSAQLRKVHREHSFMPLVFAVATCYRDIIKARLGGFPLLFLFGPTGGGKDQVIDACRTLYGMPQDPLALTGSNTGPGRINMFAEHICIPQNLSEWKNDMKPEQMEEVFALWQGVGRRRGTKTIDVSPYATDSVPIECTVYITGNDYPNVEDKGMTRFLIDEVDKTTFTADEDQQYGIMEDMKTDGYSYLLGPIVAARKEFAATWVETHYKEAQRIIREAMGAEVVAGRMMQNMTTLLCVYLFHENRLKWAFTRDELVAHMIKCILVQQKHRGEGDPVTDFWHCFVSAKRKGLIHEDVHYRIEGDRLTFYWEEMYSIYEETYKTLGRKKPCLNNTTMLSKLKKHRCFDTVIATHSIGGRKNRAQAFKMSESGTQLRGLLVTEIPADRHLGEHDGEPVTLKHGVRGPFIKYGKRYVNLPKGVEHTTVTLESALELLQAPVLETADIDDLPF